MAAQTHSRRAPAYTIPQRRGGDQEAEPRGLGDLDYGNWKAPFRVTPAPKAEVDEIDEHLQSLILGSESDSVAYIHLPKQLPLEEGAAEVLQWFSDTSQEQGAGDSPITDTGAKLALPSSLSPEERKRWHQIARTAGLYSASSGLRGNRRLLVHASAAESNEQWHKRDLKAQAQAREAHELLCEAHGGHSSYSVSELEEMVVSGVDLPPEILSQKTIKLAAAELWEALDAGKARSTIKLLQGTEFPRELACRRNAERSSYPMHAAVSGNMPEVALELANPSRYAGVFTQRDSSGKTALGLACSSRQVDLVIAFMNAGARDTGGDIDGLHRNLIRTGDHASRRQLNSSPYTTAFRRKKLNGAQSPRNKPQQGESARQNPQSRRDSASHRRKAKGQEQESSPSAGVSADENNSNEQPEVPKEASRRRLAATGMNSLRALLQHNAVALATPLPSTKMAEEQHAKHAEQPARVRRGRGRFQGSEAAAGDAPAPSMRNSARESKATARDPVIDQGAYADVAHPGVETASHISQSNAPGHSSGAAYPQDIRQGQVAHEQVQPDRGPGHMQAIPAQYQAIPTQHAQDVPWSQQATAVQYITSGVEGHAHQHQAAPTMAAVPATAAHVSPHYSTSAQPQYASVVPAHTQAAVASHPQPQYASGNYTYVTSGAATGAAPAGQSPGQMFVLMTGQDGAQYLLPVMEAQVA